MIHNKVFNVAFDDIFQREKFPDVVRELDRIADDLQLIPGNRKGEILISFFKDHAIKSEYLTTNARVIDKIRSGSLNTYYMEELFSACRSNTRFLGDYEQYILNRLTMNTDHPAPAEKWTAQVSKMKVRYTFLRDEDFRFDYGKKEVMLNSLQKKLGKDREELNDMLEEL